MTHNTPDGAPQSEVEPASTVTILVAGGANLAVSAAKLVGALTSGSAVMLSEAAHSLADTVAEVLLFVAIRRGGRAADDRHPLGHGRETYLWALLGALATFVGGAGVSFAEGESKLRQQGEPGDLTVSFIVLAVAFLLEGGSLLQSLRRVQRNARRWHMRSSRYLSVTTDTTLKAVAFEDIGALVGLSLAATGLLLTAVTGSEVWDGIASILIGGILLWIAAVLARSNSGLLVGQSASLALEAQLRADLESLPEITSVPLLFTSVLGPEQLVVAAKVEFADGLTSADILRVADDAERRFLLRHHGIKAVFLDPSRTAPPRPTSTSPDG